MAFLGNFHKMFPHGKTSFFLTISNGKYFVAALPLTKRLHQHHCCCKKISLLVDAKIYFKLENKVYIHHLAFDP